MGSSSSPREDEKEGVADVEKGVLKDGQLEQQQPWLQPSKKGDTPSGNRMGDNPGGASLLTLACRYPQLLIGPAVLFCLMVGLCIFGIVHSAKGSYNLEEQQAREEALSAADGLAKQLSAASRAALSLAAVVKMQPNWSFLDSNFDVLAEELFRQSRTDSLGSGSLPLMELTLLPFGRARAIMGKPVQRNSTADVFVPPFIDEFVPYEGIATGGLDIKGPHPLTNSGTRAFSAGYPIFFNDTDEDESWGHPDNITHPTGCPGPPCYDPETRRKFWGFSGVLVDAQPILEGNSVHLDRLLADGLSYLLTINPHNGARGEKTYVRGGKYPDKVTATITVSLPGNTWELSVYNPRQDEIMALRDGLIAMVVVLASIVSVLLLLLLLSAKRASVCLKEQLVTNKLLQEEKVAREALLGRQLDLIACLEQSTKRTKAHSRSKMTDGRQKTLERIDEARFAISGVRHSKDEDIVFQELLAEGSFGRVYKGQWRCTDVAVKVILLPGNMSGREKREKMIVWEAAISSSLVHPNICQTYHYCMKPVKESVQSSKNPANFGSAVVVSDVSSSKPRSSPLTDSDSLDETFSKDDVHSYEVHLVLEYCDRLSLRDALDAGSFMTSSGLNYAAQLDCALEIARAMLHLHCNNVLHLDLKTRNILLSSSSAEGKGLICKVSDFGLSVRMDHMETHLSNLFQGTMTHMAPEVMLKGTCSKASDVYAYGIVLWELFTGGSPFRDVPPALLGHSIVKDGKRPAWPALVPKGYKDLASGCWDQNPDARPSFESILAELTALRQELGTPTPPLQLVYSVKRPQDRNPHFQETLGSSIQPFLAQKLPQGINLPDLHQAGSPAPPPPPKPPSDPDQLPTASRANALMAIWRQPRGNKQGGPQAKGPSDPNQADVHCPKRASAPMRAVPHDGSMGVGRTLQRGLSTSAPLGRQEEGKTGSTNLVDEETRQTGLDHPQSSAPERGTEGSELNSCINMPGPPMPGPLTESTLPTPTDQLRTCPGVGSTPAVHSPYAAVQQQPCVYGGSHGSSSCSCGCHVSSHPSRAIGSPQQSLRGSVGWEDTGERQDASREQIKLTEQAVSCKRLSEEG